MGRHSINARITAGPHDLADILDWIEAFAAHQRDDRGRQVWTVSKRLEPEPLGDFGPVYKSIIVLTKN